VSTADAERATARFADYTTTPHPSPRAGGPVGGLHAWCGRCDGLPRRAGASGCATRRPRCRAPGCCLGGVAVGARCEAL